MPTSIEDVGESEHIESYLCLESGFDVGDLSEDGPDDIEGLDASAAHVANLLSTSLLILKLVLEVSAWELPLPFITCCVNGRYGNKNYVSCPPDIWQIRRGLVAFFRQRLED